MVSGKWNHLRSPLLPETAKNFQAELEMRLNEAVLNSSVSSGTPQDIKLFCEQEIRQLVNEALFYESQVDCIDETLDATDWQLELLAINQKCRPGLEGVIIALVNALKKVLPANLSSDEQKAVIISSMEAAINELFRDSTIELRQALGQFEAKRMT